MSTERTIPTTVKVAYTAFCAVMIPTYLVDYGPTNFVYFCDEAVLLTLLGVWTGWSLPISMAAAGILVPQVAWVADFVATALGHPLLGLTAYMFDPAKPLFLRALSGFHGWLPFLLVFLVRKVGYDRRAFAAWTVLATASLLVSFLFLPRPSAVPDMTPVNVDYVWGLSDVAAQTWMHPWAWLALLVFGLPLVMTAPAHFALKRFLRDAGDHRTRSLEVETCECHI